MKAVRMNNNKGFSLVELMIVVAIIGILATIAVPNFQRFQAKAKQSEARGALSAMYTAQKAFYAEWSTYYGYFGDVGYNPEGKANYNSSFGGQGTAPTSGFVAAVANSTNTNGAGCYTTVGCKTITNWIATNSATNAGEPLNSAKPTQTAFTAAASAKLSESKDIDNWTMTEGKVLKNMVNGI